MASPVPLVAEVSIGSQKVHVAPAKGAAGQVVPLSFLGRDGERGSIGPFEKVVDGVGGVVQPQVLTVRDVATKESAEGEGDADKALQELGADVGPSMEKMEKVVWQDAVESLPVAELDPEERARIEEGCWSDLS
jgi:hypothetical protein